MRTKRLLLFAGTMMIFALGAGSAPAQLKVKRDNLTPAEIEIVREAQEIDLRMAVFVKAIDRRMAVLSGSTIDPVKVGKLPKNAPDWGELPTGTPAQLYYDIEHILDEAINNIDDIATREPESKPMMKAVKILGEACSKLLPQLKAFDEKTADAKEKMALSNAMEYAGSVLDSMKKVPANIDEKEPKEKKEKKPKDS